MRQFTKKLALAVGVALLITSPAAAAEGTVRASQPKVWKIGLEGPITGSQSDIGIGMLEGAQLAAEEINAAGGVLGRQVQIIPIDDAADPAVGVTAAKHESGTKENSVSPWSGMNASTYTSALTLVSPVAALVATKPP